MSLFSQEPYATFSEYKSKKREEIQKMTRLSERVIEEDGIKSVESELLLKSYIVLSYAYWESCVEYYKDCFQFYYESFKIEDLPEKINKIVRHEVFKKNVGKRTLNKTINDLSEVDSLEIAYEKLEELPGKRINQLEISDNKKKLSKAIKRRIIESDTSNPRLNHLSFLEKIDIYWESELKGMIEDESITHVFREVINFLVLQRNNIAHKNKEIKYKFKDKEKTFEDYHTCIMEFIKDHEAQETFDVKNGMEFLDELNFQIDNFFTGMLELLNKEG